MRAFPVFPYDPIRNMEMFFIEFDSKCQHASDKHNDGVEEYIMVLNGKLQLIINGEEVPIKRNEAIRFRADVPHEYNILITESVLFTILFFILGGNLVLLNK